MIVRVYKTGLFSVFAHDHEIRAPISDGIIRIAPDPSVEFAVPVAKMTIVDPELGQSKRAEVQSTMLGPKVLDADRYPEIRFRSLRAESGAGNQWVIDGELSIRDHSRPLRVLAKEGSDGHYRGSVKINQKDYGIQPVSLAGGTIQVKAEIQIEFDVVPEESSEGPASPSNRRP
jgi:polyisoprenoid-binding protein YceI